MGRRKIRSFEHAKFEMFVTDPMLVLDRQVKCDKKGEEHVEL